MNKTTGLPGSGIGEFLQLKNEDFAKLSRTQKKIIVDKALAQIFAYPYWNDVLDEFNLEHAPSNFSGIVENAVKSAPKAGFGGGEGEAHRTLKEYVACHPELLQLDNDFSKGETEVDLPSGDCLDVSFQKGDAKKFSWVAVEVKSSISSQGDIARGIFQCVKYKAIMNAVAISEGKSQNTRVVLLLEGQFPDALVPLKNILGIEVVDGINPLG